MDVHSPVLEQLVAGFPLVSSGPISAQEILNDILTDHGMRKPTPIPVSLNHPTRFQVDYRSLLDLTSHTGLKSVLADEDKFFDKHRLTVTEFLLLLSCVKPAIERTREKSTVASHHSSHAHTKLNAGEQLLLWLYWTSGCPLSLVTDLFGNLHETTLYRMVDHVTLCINSVLGDTVQWPTAEERRGLYGYLSVCDKAVAILDGTHCEIKKPTENQRMFHSGHKHKHTQNYLVCVNAFAHIIYVDGPYPGRANDRGLFNQCSLACRPTDFVSEGEVILADGGFIGGEPLLAPVHSDIIMHAESEEEKEMLLDFNDELSEGRVLVEDVFSWLKARAWILSVRFPRKRERQGDVFFATCCMYNFIRMLRMEYANAGRVDMSP
jgi:hypothetical protein